VAILSLPAKLRNYSGMHTTITIFTHLSLENWQELGCPDSSKFLQERTLDLLNLPNYPDDQHELLKKGEYLISEDRMYLSKSV
jgi:hypothetical protein